LRGPGGAGSRVYAADLAGGAKVCEVARVSPVDGQTVDGTMKIGNDNGWCGLPLRQSAARPFDAGLLTARPAHGSVLIHQVGDDTRIDYTPDRGFTGSDSFTVKLIPGDAVVRMSVTIIGPSAKG
jgi:hypothetical protein